ncbi:MULTISPECIES: TetR/AcrR family transcriptional regulator [Mycolicibacterium]|uniref:TetR/AcrR family transcriptional regulator n=1 Tax=Mycolicibacterium TaxID=1866885 RepID=UPI0006D7F737|nr:MULTISPECIES: TetR family transcriptional regulator [Mycolicibacterium]ODR24867.1 TetR family transcriptional regulator [Mycolicibacterium porcinum]ORW53952.1 TetR family transcriptional regulator [Mycolicibacterium peregrinum]
MNAVDFHSRDDGTVKDRLIRAADEEITARGINAVQMEVVAKIAGVSRATAFRQLGSVSEMLVQVALLRARRHVLQVEAIMAAKTGVFAKIEAALVYTAQELPSDPSISALIAQHSATVHDPRVHQVAVDAMGPVLVEGQQSGEVRTDIEIDEMVDFLVEQTYLAAEEIDRSEDEVIRRFRHFIIPGLAASNGFSGERISRTMEVQVAVGAALDALNNLADQLRHGKP